MVLESRMDNLGEGKHHKDDLTFNNMQHAVFEYSTFHNKWGPEANHLNLIISPI